MRSVYNTSVEKPEWGNLLGNEA